MTRGLAVAVIAVVIAFSGCSARATHSILPQNSVPAIQPPTSSPGNDAYTELLADVRNQLHVAPGKPVPLDERRLSARDRHLFESILANLHLASTTKRTDTAPAFNCQNSGLIISSPGESDCSTTTFSWGFIGCPYGIPPVELVYIDPSSITYLGTTAPGVTFSGVWSWELFAEPSNPANCLGAFITTFSVSSSTPYGKYSYSYTGRVGQWVFTDTEPIWIVPPKLPAPVSAKSTYTASLLSKPTITFTDSADAGKFGTLTWNLQSPPGIQEAHLSTTTTNAPHSNALSMSLPLGTPPGDYNFGLSVTSSTSKSTSDVTHITVRVLPPVASEADDNWLSVYQVNSMGEYSPSDGSDVITDDDGTIPDFPIDLGSATNATNLVARSQQVLTPGFDPENPPAAFAKILNSKPQKYMCGGLLVDDNTAHDRGSGTAQGLIQFYAYCGLAIPSGLAFNSSVGAYTLFGVYIEDGHFSDSPCVDTGKRYGAVWEICKTAELRVTSLSGHAERDTFYFHLEVPGLSGIPEDANNNTFYINNKGVFYPVIYAQPSWGNVDNGVVPFAPDPSEIKRCLGPGPGCYNNGRNPEILRRNLDRAGFAKPGPDFQAHHILPTSWGGDDRCDRPIALECNGVWLPRLKHQPFTDWWRPTNFSL